MTPFPQGISTLSIRTSSFYCSYFMHLGPGSVCKVRDYISNCVNHHGQIQASEVTDLQDLTSKSHSRDGHYNFVKVPGEVPNSK